MPTDTEWLAILNRARLVQPGPPVAASLGTQIRGRFIAVLVNRVVKFWGEHESTLRPFLTQLAIAALDALTTAVLDIRAVDPPGPA